jgi:hypothetical protein
MKLFGRRQREQDNEQTPIFLDAHSVEGASEEEEEDVPNEETNTTFTARIIISDGSKPASSEEPAQEAGLDTTLGLENCSDCSSEAGNELIIITSAVLESDLEDVEAPPPESPLEEPTTPESEEIIQKEDKKVPQKEENRGRIQQVLFCLVCIVVFIGTVLVASFVPGDKGNQSANLLASKVNSTEIATETPTAMDTVFDGEDFADPELFLTLWYPTNASNSSEETIPSESLIIPPVADDEATAASTSFPVSSSSSSSSGFQPFNFSTMANLNTTLSFQGEANATAVVP